MELEEFVELVEITGAAVATVTAGDFDLATPDGRLHARITGAVARKESEDKSRRLRGCTQRSGGQRGRRPYGYRNDRVTPEPVEARVVVEIVERIAQGQTLTGVADSLNARGIGTTNDKPWTIHAIRRWR